MSKLIYIVGVSGTGKTSIVETYVGKEGVTPIFFSKLMKEYGMKHQIISAPEELYSLPSDIRDSIENGVWETIKEGGDKKRETMILDGHLFVEKEDGEIRQTFADDVAGAFSKIIFLHLPVEAIIENRAKRGAFRPQSLLPERIEQLQEMSYKRAEELSQKYAIPLVTIYNTTNDLSYSIKRVADEIGI